MSLGAGFLRWRATRISASTTGAFLSCGHGGVTLNLALEIETGILGFYTRAKAMEWSADFVAWPRNVLASFPSQVAQSFY